MWHAGENVTGGIVKVSINYMNIIPVVDKQFQLCNLAISVLKTCPLEAGVHEATLTESLPSYAPSVSSSYTYLAGPGLTKCLCEYFRWSFSVSQLCQKEMDSFLEHFFVSLYSVHVVLSFHRFTCAAYCM